MAGEQGKTVAATSGGSGSGKKRRKRWEGGGEMRQAVTGAAAAAIGGGSRDGPELAQSELREEPSSDLPPSRVDQHVAI